jgi:hypothetical protein
MTVKVGDFSKMSPEEQKQFQSLLQKFPELRSKMDTARELNTGTNPFDAPAEDDGTLDFEAIEKEQREAEAKPVAPTHLGAVTIDPESDFGSKSLVSKEEQAELEHKQRAEYEKRHAKDQPKPKPAEAPKQPEFHTEGKLHPVLVRARKTLGMDVPETKTVVTVGDVNYTMRRLDRDEVIKATSLATLNCATDLELRGNIEAAIISYSVREMDGVLTEDVFEVPREEYSPLLKRSAMLSGPERHDRAAKKFFAFLKEAPNELNTTLVAYYEQEFPALNLFGKGHTQGYCPAPECQFKAVIDKGVKRYCPLHGGVLVPEEALPNPF